MSRLFIGVAGGSGSGKSTFTNRLKDEFGDKVTVIYYDNYYKAHHDIPFEDRKLINYDHPDAFETDLLISHLRELRNGNSIECPVYDFTVHDRSDKVMTIEPSDIMIIEGIMVLQNEQLRDLLDIKIFVDADADDRLIRVAQRDIVERGRTIEAVMERYQRVLKPMHEQFIEPCKRYADVIIPQGGHNNAAINMLMKFIKQELKEKK